jgi:AcrR family transcriptional regulator
MLENRSRIIEAAARIYAAHGYRGATTRRIAEEAGVNEVTLFRQFGSKSALLDAMVEAFIVAAQRAEKAGFDGVELHAAHGYILAQFLSAEINHRGDRYGGSLANRQRVIFDIIQGIRQRCGSDFMLGVCVMTCASMPPMTLSRS